MQATSPEMIKNGMIAFFAYILADAVWHAHKKRRDDYLALLKTVYWSGWKNYLSAIAILFSTLLIAVYAAQIVPPVFNKGWLHLFMEVDANPSVMALTQVQRTEITLWPFVMAASYLILLALAMPLATRREERWFRKNRIHYRPMIISSVLFGLMHLLIGVPIILAIALILPGFIFALRYRQVYYQHYQINKTNSLSHKTALDASTALHGMYNTWIVVIIMGSVVAYQL